MLSISDYRARGNGLTDCTGAIRQAIDACGAAGGGTVLIPPGCYLSGPLTLRDHVRLRLEPGAVLRAVAGIAGWPLIPDPYAGKSADRLVFQPFIYAENARNVGVVGSGTVDGAGQPWWDALMKGRLRHRRPRLIAPNGCTGVEIAGITVTNSPEWTVNPVCCDNVRLHALTVLNPDGSPNTDGLNPDSCRNVRISDCHIDVGDDCITLKSGVEDSLRPPGRAACENIAITNCTMLHGHGGVVCGSEMSGNVRNVVIDNCVFRGTDRGLRFKSRRGRGGIIENIRMNNIVMEDVKTPFVVNLFYNCDSLDEPPRRADTGTPRLTRLRFSHITAYNAHYAAGVFLGLPEMPASDIVLHDVDVFMHPDPEAGPTCSANAVPPMCKKAFFCRHVSGLRFRTVRVENHAGPFIDAGNCAGWHVDPENSVENEPIGTNDKAERHAAT